MNPIVELLVITYLGGCLFFALAYALLWNLIATHHRHFAIAMVAIFGWPIIIPFHLYRKAKEKKW